MLILLLSFDGVTLGIESYCARRSDNNTSAVKLAEMCVGTTHDAQKTLLKQRKKRRMKFSCSRVAAPPSWHVPREINFTYCEHAALASKMDRRHRNYRARHPLRHAPIWDIVQSFAGAGAKARASQQ
jgi:hypothetical protein